MYDSPANDERRFPQEPLCKESSSPSVETSLARRRIETQVHRRKTAKAVPPFEAEWNEESPGPPVNLRTPSDKMEKRARDRESG